MCTQHENQFFDTLISQLIQISSQAKFTHKHGALAFVNKKIIFKPACNEYTWHGLKNAISQYQHNYSIHAEMSSIRNTIQELMQQYVLQVFKKQCCK